MVNNQLASIRKYRKKWQDKVVTWFNQPARKQRRRAGECQEAASQPWNPAEGAAAPGAAQHGSLAACREPQRGWRGTWTDGAQTGSGPGGHAAQHAAWATARGAAAQPAAAAVGARRLAREGSSVEHWQWAQGLVASSDRHHWQHGVPSRGGMLIVALLLLCLPAFLPACSSR
jgi:hypothetical protein